jgi:Dolichyl-phosphate-mannose-protein mannosyltransferase
MIPPPAASSLPPATAPRFQRPLLLAFSSLLILSAAAFVAITRHWPVVADAALMQYTVFLIGHGWAPYRDLLDVNMPGAYLATAIGMRLPGSLEASWRLFDLSLVAAAGAAYYAIARPYSRFAALFAGVMLLLVHGQDGIQQAGQRDLAMAVLLLAGVAFLLTAIRTQRASYLLPFGLAIGLASTIKPTALPIGAVLLALAIAHRAGWLRDKRSHGRGLIAWTALGLAGILAPLAAMLLWLARHRSLAAWLQTERVLLPYYAALGSRPPGFTLLHSLSPLLPLILLWLLCVAAGGPRWPRFERLVLATVTALSLLALLAQGKALPYQRYPMLAFLLLLIATDLATALRARLLPRTAAVAALACGCLVLAPLALLRVHRFQPAQEFKALLAADLRQAHADRSRAVQCIDTIGECLPTLYSLGLEPATGTLYDIFLFGDVHQAAVRLGRERLRAQLAAQPPTAIVVVSGFFLDGSSGYRKLESWPEFAAWLDQHYTRVTERMPPHPVRWWSRPQPPSGYRLYLAKEAAFPAATALH